MGVSGGVSEPGLIEQRSIVTQFDSLCNGKKLDDINVDGEEVDSHFRKRETLISPSDIVKHEALADPPFGATSESVGAIRLFSSIDPANELPYGFSGSLKGFRSRLTQADESTDRPILGNIEQTLDRRLVEKGVP